MGVGFVVDNGYFQYLFNMVIGTSIFAQLHDSLGLVVVKVGVAFQLVEGDAVEIHLPNVGRVGIEVGCNIVISDRVHALDLPQLAFVHKSSQSCSVADDASGKSGTYIVELH